MFDCVLVFVEIVYCSDYFFFKKIDFYLIFYNFLGGGDVVGNIVYNNNIVKIIDFN